MIPETCLTLGYNVMTTGVIDTRDMSDTRNNVMTIGVIDTRDMSHTMVMNNVMSVTDHRCN